MKSEKKEGKCVLSVGQFDVHSHDKKRAGPLVRRQSCLCDVRSHQILLTEPLGLRGFHPLPSGAASPPQWNSHHTRPKPSQHPSSHIFQQTSPSALFTSTLLFLAIPIVGIPICRPWMKVDWTAVK